MGEERCFLASPSGFKSHGRTSGNEGGAVPAHRVVASLRPAWRQRLPTSVWRWGLGGPLPAAGVGSVPARKGAVEGSCSRPRNPVCSSTQEGEGSPAQAPGAGAAEGALLQWLHLTQPLPS